MQGITRTPRHICTHCFRARTKAPAFWKQSTPKRWKSSASSPRAPTETTDDNGSNAPQPPTSSAPHNISTGTPSHTLASGSEDNDTSVKGALTRRLEQMSEESLETGGRSARNAVKEADFSEDLRRQLEERIAGANFRNEHASAFAQAELPASAGRGTRDIAGAQPWTGVESVEDASLRMLTDAYKPLRGVKSTIPSPSGVAIAPPGMNSSSRSAGVSRGVRLANARDKSSVYSSMKDSDNSEAEREQRFRQMKERFLPHARAVPATIQGLASLANERIEDAMARGQFKNLPRGKKVERDYNASSPFINTTEYFMNKIIQKQDIVPPWIEKQQELVSTANKFRSRLRNDWRRHAARLIASKGGTLNDQVRAARAYAAAEAVDNPPRRKQETLSMAYSSGHLSQITLSGELKIPSLEVGEKESTKEAETEVHISATEVSVDQPANASTTTTSTTTIAIPTATKNTTASTNRILRASKPFRDPAWEASELSYHTVAIEHLNNLTRSYNLMAPDLAKKPYYSLPRELQACYADIAPQLADAILERATAPKARVEVIGHTPGGVMERFGAGQSARVRDERVERRYGFKEFWKDLFGNKEGGGPP